MAHTKPENLVDLAVELREIRALPALKEKSPGVFYFKSTPFLHFHDKAGLRWADVKGESDWVRLEIPFDATKKQRKDFLGAVKAAHGLFHRP